MNHTVQYKGYTASIEYSDEDACYIGDVIGMKDNMIVFDGNTIEEAHLRFVETIDFYLGICKDEGREPEIPTAILIPLPTDVFNAAFEKAEHKGLTVPKFIAEVLQTV